ncbi:MAG: HAMP domain-containing histidine kinase, partial [Anaerolineae bacterium]|nr:HAMP domain-containing histidine kinase [Anaerolineae bacterium]
ALQVLQALQQQTDGEIKVQLDDVAQLLEAAVRRGEGEEAEALRQQIDAMILTNAQFVSVMVHEIRVPMTSIKGYSDMLAKNVMGELNEMQTQFVETIRSNVSRMEHLVTDISDMSKLTAGQMRLDPKMDMYKNVSMQVEKDTAELAEEHKHNLVFDTPQGLPLLNLDSTRLGQVLTKLVINALQYTPDGGEIVVRAEDVGGKLKVTVTDNGIGMTEEEQARVGELFWRGESEHVRTFKGHGLGLPICIGLIKELGGEFFYETTFEQGSTFGFIVSGMS